MPHQPTPSDEGDQLEGPHESGEMCEENQRLIQQAAETCALTRKLLRKLEAEHPSPSGPARASAAIHEARETDENPGDAGPD